jgi:hypothetical protein
MPSREVKKPHPAMQRPNASRADHAEAQRLEFSKTDASHCAALSPVKSLILSCWKFSCLNQSSNRFSSTLCEGSTRVKGPPSSSTISWWPGDSQGRQPSINLRYPGAASPSE